MRLIAFAALAATAAAVAPASAQTVPDPDPYYGVPAPPPGMQRQRPRPAPPAPGVTWQGQQGPQGQPMPQRMHPDGSMAPPMPQGGRTMFILHRDGDGMQGHAMGAGPMAAPMGGQMGQMGPMGGPMRMQMQMRHIPRGGRVPPAFAADRRFEVRDWRRFGWPAPFAGGRWIRFQNDALLIDGNGMVYDSRPDWRWDGDADGGGRMEEGRMEEGRMEERRMDGWAGGNVRTRTYVEQRGMPMMPPPPPGYYGYGPVVVTETTVTEAPVVEQRTYVRTVVERVAVRHRRRHVRRCTCRAVAPPAEVLGERG